MHMGIDRRPAARRPWNLAAIGLVALAAAACSSAAPTTNPPDREQEETYRYGSLSGGEGFNIFGGGGRQGADPSEGGVLGVNSFLWRATLDTLAFMPIASADPFGGVIITDWYTPPQTAGDRFKVNAYILGRQLRADGIRVAVFRQEQNGGQWVDAAVAPETVRQLEDAILLRARELRVASNAARGG